MIRLETLPGLRRARPLERRSAGPRALRSTPVRTLASSAMFKLGGLALGGFALADFAFAVTVAAAEPAVGAARREDPCAAAADAKDVPRSLAEILDRVSRSPRMAAAAGDNAALDALTGQAGTRPNPELAVEVEDFTGSGSYSAFGQTQTTVSLTQKIELGDRRARRVDLAVREGATGKARGADEALRGAVAAKQRVVECVASRERLAIAHDGERLAVALLRDAERRAAAGAGSVADTERARIAVAAAGLEIFAAERESVVAAQRLAGLWGGDATDAACVADALARGGLVLPAPVPAAPGGRGATRATPTAVVIAEAEVEAERAALDLARAAAAPDLEIGAGLRHLAGPGSVSVVAGLRIEVPIFDRNAGAITAAGHRLGAAQARALAARRDSEARRARLGAALALSAQRAGTLRESMIPAAERAFAALSKSWQTGVVSALEVLEARRTLVELRLQQLDALAEYHRTLVSLEGSLGTVPDRFDPAMSTFPSEPAPAKD